MKKHLLIAVLLGAAGAQMSDPATKLILVKPTVENKSNDRIRSFDRIIVCPTGDKFIAGSYVPGVNMKGTTPKDAMGFVLRQNRGEKTWDLFLNSTVAPIVDLGCYDSDQLKDTYLYVLTSSVQAGGQLSQVNLTANQLEWSTGVAEHPNSLASRLTVDSQGNVFVGGTTHGDNLKNEVAFVQKFTPQGTSKILKLLEGNANQSVKALTVNAKRELVVVGLTDGKLGKSQFGRKDVFVMKMKTSDLSVLHGVLQYGTSEDDLVVDVASDTQGQIYLGLNTLGKPPGMNVASGMKGVVLKLSSALQPMKGWPHVIDTPEADLVSSVQLGPDGNVVVAGYSDGKLGAGSKDAVKRGFVKVFDPLGTELQIREASQAGITAFFDVAFGLNGSLYLVGGSSQSQDPKDNGAVLVSLDPDFERWCYSVQDSLLGVPLTCQQPKD